VSEKPLSKCPACGKKSYKKQLTAAGFQLKGSGWYATDFKNSGRKPEAKTSSKNGDAAPSESKAESKAEASTPAPAAGCGAKCSCH